MSVNFTNPTVGVCRPLYYEDYFIFDREDLLTVSARSDITSVRNREDDPIDLSASETRTVTDIAFWSFIVVAVSLLLLSLTFCCHCCLCCFTRRSSAQRKTVKMPFLMVFGCGIFIGAVILLSFIDNAILMWMEIDLNQNLTGQADAVQFYINMTTRFASGDNETVKQITLDPLFRLQDIRFWITLAFQGSSLVILAIMFLSVCICTPISKSSAPIVIMLIVEGLCTFFASLAASALFGTLLFFSIVCYDLYRLGGARWCDTTNNSPLVQTLGRFCGRESLTRFYTMAGVYGILVLLLVLVQLLGGIYTAVVSQGYKERPQRRRQTSHHTQGHHRPQQHQPQQHRQQQHHPHDQRRSSRNAVTQRSTTTSTVAEETFILRSRDPSHYHHHRQRQNSSSIGYAELGANLGSHNLSVSSHPHNAFKLSTITYPTEEPPSYDEVIRRDSNSSASVPLIASSAPYFQGLSSVQEDVEAAIQSDSVPVAEVEQPDGNQEDGAIVEENMHADTELDTDN